MPEDNKQVCPHHEYLVRDVTELREEVFGSNESGLKYKFIQLAAEFKSLKKSMSLNNWLTGIMAGAMVGALVKVLFFM